MKSCSFTNHRAENLKSSKISIGNVIKALQCNIEKEIENSTKVFYTGMWVTNMTKSSFIGTKLYLSPILNLCSNDLVNYTISNRSVRNIAISMLDKVFEKNTDDTNLILYSEQSWQY